MNDKIKAAYMIILSTGLMAFGGYVVKHLTKLRQKLIEVKS